MKITIENAEICQPTHLQKCIDKALNYAKDTKDITIFCMPGQDKGTGRPEWLEYGILLEFNSGTKLYLAAIQRTRTAEIEFHS